jgi:hypothetical protein
MTRKRNAAFILTFIVGMGMFAQEKQKPVHICLKATPGIYWLSASAPAASNGAKFGFGYGANIEIGLNETIFLVTGLEVNAAGAKYTSTDTLGPKGARIANTFTGNASIQYLQLPLFFKMKTKEIGMLRYFGQFGLGTGIAISNSTAWTNSSSGLSTGLAASGTDTKTSDISLFREALLIGAGVEYNISGSTSLIGSIMYDKDSPQFCLPTATAQAEIPIRRPLCIPKASR